MQGTSGLAQELLVYQNSLCSMKLISSEFFIWQYKILYICTLGGGGCPSAVPLHCPDDSRSTCSLSRTHKDARASQRVGVCKHSDGVRCASSNFVRFKMFSATAPFVTFAQASDSLPWNSFPWLNYQHRNTRCDSFSVCTQFKPCQSHKWFAVFLKEMPQ